MIKPQNIAILGASGSIGTQTLDVVRAHRELFQIELLSAHTAYEQLARWAIEFSVGSVVITDERYYEPLVKLLESHPIKVYAGAQALEQEVQNSNIDTVVTAVSGFAGLLPTIAAIKAGKKIALANKETLVVAGELVVEMSKQYSAPIIPIDSEHSAIFQSLVGESSPARRVVITASGGALRDMPLEQLEKATIEQVLSHPTWSMGAKITVDSATMLNKGLEVIEAHHLFGLDAAQIDVVLHRESIIHSMVEFEDGAFKAQLGTADMRLPIQYALTFPHRLSVKGSQGYTPLGSLNFQEIDPLRYPALFLAYDALREGGTAPVVLNASAEVAVERFLKGELAFTDIAKRVEAALNRFETQKIETIEQIVEVDRMVRLGQ